MQLDTRVMDFPAWMQPRSPWTQQDTARLLNLGLEQKQQAQQDVLRMRELDLKDKQMTAINEARLSAMDERELAIRDAPKLAHYMKTGELPEPLESPKSYAHIAQIDASRYKSEVGRQTIADIADFNKRLLKVSAEDRAQIRDMQRQGSPESEVWSYLGTAERAEQERIADTKRQMTDYQMSQVELAWQRQEDLAEHRSESLEVQRSRLSQDLAKFDITHDVALQKLGMTKERLEFDRERLKAGKAIAPTEIRKLFDEANDAESRGMKTEADILRQRASTLARGGRERSIQAERAQKEETLQSFKLKLLPKLRADTANRKKTDKELDAEATELFNLATAGAAQKPAFQITPDTGSTNNFIFQPGKGLVPKP